MKEAIISTKELCKTYFADGEGVHIIKNINLDIYKGEFTVIMGSSGSGKSTLLYLLSGLENKTSGDIKVLNKDLGSFKEKELAQFRRADMGFIYQGINLVQSLTLLENVVLPSYLLGDKKTSADDRAKLLLEKVGLGKEIKKIPTKVSGGQQQRCAIARALINNPGIIFADEPTGSLNSKAGEEILDMLTELKNDGKTIVMVTHDMKAAIRAARIIFIGDGRIEGELSLGEYKKAGKEYREKEVFAYLTEMGW